MLYLFATVLICDRVCVYVCTHPEKRSPAKTSRQHVCRSNHPQTVSLNTINNMPARHIPSPGVRPAPGTSSPALHPTNKRGRPTYAAVSHQNVALERRPSAMLGRHRDRPLFAAVAFVVRRVVTDPAPGGGDAKAIGYLISSWSWGTSCWGISSFVVPRRRFGLMNTFVLDCI